MQELYKIDDGKQLTRGELILDHCVYWINHVKKNGALIFKRHEEKDERDSRKCEVIPSHIVYKLKKKRIMLKE